MTNIKEPNKCDCMRKAKKCNCSSKTKNSMECDCNVIHADSVERARKDLFDDEILLYMADFYKALSDSTRIKIINLLCGHELCVCDISSLLNMTKSAISHQLQNLKEMNLIKSEKKGKEVWYSLADRHVEEMFKICHEHVLEELSENEG